MKHFSLAVLLLASSVLGACGDDEPAPQPTQQPVAPKPKAAATSADPTAKMARAYISGKQSAPVDLKYDVASKPQPGKVLDIDLAFVTTAVADSMAVTIASGTPGLEILSGATANFGILKIGEVTHHKISVRGDRADVLYFTVTATLHAVGVNSSRTWSIPLIFLDPAGPAAATSANATADAQAKPDAAGQKVQSLPARENK
jgi:hypothetical protein